MKINESRAERQAALCDSVLQDTRRPGQLRSGNLVDDIPTSSSTTLSKLGIGFEELGVSGGGRGGQRAPFHP